MRSFEDLSIIGIYSGKRVCFIYLILFNLILLILRKLTASTFTYITEKYVEQGHYKFPLINNYVKERKRLIVAHIYYTILIIKEIHFS